MVPARSRVARTPRIVAALAIVAPLVGCAAEIYTPDPIDPARTADRLAARSIESRSMREALAAQGYPWDMLTAEGWPLGALTVAALHENPALAAARADWRTRLAAEQSAAQGPVPAIGPVVEYHGDQSPFDESPWSVGVGFEVTFVTAGKTETRVDRARALTEEFGLAVAATAWRLRRLVRDSYVDCFDAAQGAALAALRLDDHEMEVRLFDVRQAVGEASPAEVDRAKRRLAATRLDQAASAGARETCRAGLAEALGVTRDEAAALRLRFDDLAQQWPDPAPYASARRAALVNRLDVRTALARYEGAEAALRLEIARQYPDVTVSPAVLWDQGDLVWSLGSTLLLTVINRNAAPIAAAEAAREAGAARLLLVQSQVQSDLERAVAAYDSAIHRFRVAHAGVAQERARLARLERRIDAGEADRLALIRARLELTAAREAAGRERTGVLRALSGLEDATQHPILGDPGIARLLDEMAPAGDRMVRVE